MSALTLFALALYLVGVVTLAYSESQFFRPTFNHKSLSAADFGPIRHRSHIHNIFGHSFTYTNIYSSVNASNPLIFVTDYGADPNGKTDSTLAFQKAITIALSRGSSNAILANGIHDCGGATIHLSGGDFLISQPLIIPQYYGNLRIVFGTIRASKTFTPTTSYLLIIGDNSNSTCNNSQGSCNENIAIENIMFDASMIAYGAVHVISTMGFVVGPQMFFLGFTGAGITVSGGHESMISNTWMGEYLYSSSEYNDATSTAIQLFGMDHYITNTIVFSAKIGVHITNPANILEGVHTWNMNTEAGGIGILVQSTQCRFIGCYLDGNDLILTAPIETVSFQDGFFLSDGRIILRANGEMSVINGLYIVGNEYLYGTSVPILSLDESEGTFVSVSHMTVNGNLLQYGHIYRQPRLSMSVTGIMQTVFSFNFSANLLFNCSVIPIAWIDYSVQYNDDSSFVSHALRKPNGAIVVVEFSTSVNATVYLTVDQSVNACY